MGVTARVLPEGVVTCCFTDIEGSTRLLQNLGDRYADVLEVHRGLIRSGFVSFGGVEVKSEGDGFFFVFPDAAAAVAASADAQRALVAADFGEGAAVRVRMGLHTGEVSVRAGDYVGLAVHQAARVGAAGHGLQVLLTDATVAAAANRIGPGAGTRSLGRFRLKDFDTPVELFQLDVEGLPLDFPPPNAPDAALGNLPRPPSSFVGRVEVIHELAKLVERNSILTITGPGGVGKTRAAVEIGRRVAGTFPGGAWFVDLANVREAGLVASAVAAALGVTREPGRNLLASIARRLSADPTLVLFDNAEHVLDEVAESVAELLRGAPDTTVLVTSQEPLRIAGEQVYRLPPMTTADEGSVDAEATILFLERARQADARFSPTPASKAIMSRIIIALDGIPLAIELAAAAVGWTDLEDIEAELQARFDLLAGQRGVADRHRSLRACIEWSFNLLDEETRSAFAALSAFAGPFLLTSAAAVLDRPEAEVTVLLSRLDDRSLIAPDDDGDESRYRMLESIRAFAAEQLATSDEAPAVRDRHLAVCRRRWRSGADGMVSADQLAWRRELERDLPDLRVALDWAANRPSGPDASGACELVADALELWEITWSGEEAHGRIASALALPGASPASRLRALLAAGRMAYVRTDGRSSATAYAEALDLAEQLDDDAGRVRALTGLVLANVMVGDKAEAAAIAQRAVELSELGLGIDRQRAVHAAGIVPMFEGSFEAATKWFERAEAIAEAIGHRRGQIRAQMNIGSCLMQRGQNRAAQEALARAHAGAVEIGDDGLAASTLLALGDAASDAGRYEEARLIYLRTLATAARMGAAGLEVNTLNNLGNLVARSGDFAGARPWLERGLSRARELDSAEKIALVLSNLADTLVNLGQLDLAEQSLLEARQLAEAISDRPRVIMTEINLGYLNLARQQTAASVDAFRAAADGAAALGSLRRQVMALVGMVRAYDAAGEHEAALTVVGEALPLIEATEDQPHAVALAGPTVAALRQCGVAAAADDLETWLVETSEPDVPALVGRLSSALRDYAGASPSTRASH